MKTRNEFFGTHIKCMICSVALGLAAATSALAASPQQLFGKSVVVSANIYTPARADDGTPSAARIVTLTFYISSQGRAFVRADHVGSSEGRPSSRGEKGPESRTAHFSGNRLIAAEKLVSGAAQVNVSFDPSYRTCAANVVVGREGDQPLSFIGFNGKRYTAIGTQVSNVSCAIRDGNALGS